MQATLGRDRRHNLRQQVQNNIFAIANRVDELEKATAELRNHLHLHDRFFFQHQANLAQDETYGTQEDLEGLLDDTVQMISRLEKARDQMKSACTLMHFYDYGTNPVFEEFATVEAENL
jgi:ABC-type transporter Mla subunit MlaD